MSHRDYDRHGFTPSTSFYDLLGAWRALSPDRLESYFAGRSLWPLTPSERSVLRYTEGIEAKFNGRMFIAPALVAALSDGQRIVYFQVLLLAYDGASPITVPMDKKEVKVRLNIGPWVDGKMTPIPNNAAVRLGPIKDRALALAEGIETAMAYSRLYGQTCWAGLGWHRFDKFVPPSSTLLTLALDNDRESKNAARKAVDRRPWLGTRQPVRGCNDFNDQLMREIKRRD